jgi:hypothetical protein
VSDNNAVVAEHNPRRVAVGKTLLIAAVCAIIPLIGNVVASFLTTWTGTARWLAGPAVGVGVAMATALIQAYGSAPADEAPRPRAAHDPVSRAPYPAARPPYPAPRPAYPMTRAKPRGVALPAALLTAVLVIGVGGLAVTEGVRYAVGYIAGYITGNEQGTSRLVRPVSATGGGVALTVQSVTYTAHFIRVGVVARNQTRQSLDLPLFDNCVFTGSDGTTLQADPDRSQWSITLPPGVPQRGVIIFNGHLDPSIRQASLSFAQIYGQLSGGSITVRNIELKPG